MRPLVALVLAEFVALVALAVLWLAGSGTAAAQTGSPSESHEAPREAPVPASGAVPAAADAPAPSPAREPAPVTTTGAIAANDAIGIVLSGTIRSADGALVEGANVYLNRADTYRNGGSASPGCYAIAGLQPGEWTMTCRAEGFAQYEAKVALDERAFQQIDLELKPNWVVRVKVQGADGKSILQELRQKTMWGLPYVVATDAPLTGDLPPTDNSVLLRFGLGEWRSYDGMSGNADPKAIEQGYCGELRMNRAPPAHASLLLRTTLLQSQRIDAGQKELVFTIETKDVLAKHGTVKFRLVDTEGAAVAGVVVGVSTAQGGGTHGKTGEDGGVVIENVLPGLGRLEARMGAKDRESLFRYLSVPSGGTLDLGDVVLSAATKITGVVVDANGKPANGASVQWTELDCRTFPQPLVGYRSSTADAEGKFELWGCGRHRYVVFAYANVGAERAFGYATVDASPGAPGAVTIALRKPTAVKLNASFDATTGRVVTALAGDRSPVAVATLSCEWRASSMSLPPGDYTIEVHDLSSHRLVRAFALHVASEPLTIDVP